MDEYYETFREIRRRKICPKQIYRQYGCHAAFDLNSKCPVVVKKGGMPLDVLAQNMGFGSADELYETIKNYNPKYKWEKEIRDYYEEEE